MQDTIRKRSVTLQLNTKENWKQKRSKNERNRNIKNKKTLIFLPKILPF